ncbi:MAG: hypothetical protein MJ224_02260 [archaeon]|nr:hypothetical protein [archaeon]
MQLTGAGDPLITKYKNKIEGIFEIIKPVNALILHSLLERLEVEKKLKFLEIISSPYDEVVANK